MADTAPTQPSSSAGIDLGSADLTLAQLEAALEGEIGVNAPAEEVPGAPDTAAPTPSDPPSDPSHPDDTEVEKPAPDAAAETPEADPQQQQPDPAAQPPNADPAAQNPKGKQWRARVHEGSDDEKIMALHKAGYSIAEAAAMVAAKSSAAPKLQAQSATPAPAPAAPQPPKPEVVHASIRQAEQALEAAMDAGNHAAYAQAASQLAELRTTLPESEIMQAIAASRKAAKQAERNVDFTAQAQAERDVQKWQQALDAKHAQVREATARDAQQRQTAHAEQVKASVAKARANYSFANESDPLFPEFEAFLESAVQGPEYRDVIANSPNWPGILSDAFAAERGIVRGAKKQAAAPAPAPASAQPPKPKTAVPATKARILSAGSSASPAEAPSPEAFAKQVVEKAKTARTAEELEELLDNVNRSGPGANAFGF